MGCSACGAASVINNGAKQSFKKAKVVAENNSGPCEYSKGMLEDFEERLIWFKERGLFIQNRIPAKTLNKYIGIVKTSLNVSNPCKFQLILAKVSDLVNLIIVLQDAE